MNGSSREQTGWYFYDWANSAFATTVLALFLGPYLTSIAKAAADPAGYVYPLGLPVDARSYWTYVVSLSVFLQVLFLPLLGAIADYGQRKKQLLALFAYTGASATMAMFFLKGRNYLQGGALFVIANLSFGASVVIYNAFLPEIASPDERDSVSSKGWGIGYIGGGLLLALNLILLANANRLGLTESQAVRASLCSAGAWWAIFTVIPLVALRNRRSERRLPPGKHYVTVGLQQLQNTFGKIRKLPQTLLFLLAYLIYNDGIQTVITLAAQFGNDELKIPMSQLALAILMVQFVGFFGAIAFGRLANVVGAKRSVVFSLLVWTAVLVYIYLGVRTVTEFFVMAAILGMVMGGSQALSRSIYSLMIPKEQEAEYFSLYEISDKGTSWLGPLVFGLAQQFTRSYRAAILSLITFFVTGLVLLMRVNVRRAAIEAGNQPARANLSASA